VSMVDENEWAEASFVAIKKYCLGLVVIGDE
jgi:hypothetical protein